jgi:hypothetical protein
VALVGQLRGILVPIPQAVAAGGLLQLHLLPLVALAVPALLLTVVLGVRGPLALALLWLTVAAVVAVLLALTVLVVAGVLDSAV